MHQYQHMNHHMSSQTVAKGSTSKKRLKNTVLIYRELGIYAKLQTPPLYPTV